MCLRSQITSGCYVIGLFWPVATKSTHPVPLKIHSFGIFVPKMCAHFIYFEIFCVKFYGFVNEIHKNSGVFFRIYSYYSESCDI